jgi:uncharacterized protein YbjT (DUF2867 family)
MTVAKRLRNEEMFMFVVTDITGRIGSATVRVLLAAGKDVRAVVDSHESGLAWAGHGCSIAIASMDNADALGEAFIGADGVCILLPSSFNSPPSYDESCRMIAAIRKALDATRPSRVVCVSSIGAHVVRRNPLQRFSILERELGTLPIPLALLRAAWLMEDAVEDVESALAKGVVPSFLQPLDRKFPMVAAADVGRTAAGLLLQHSQYRRVVELEGPQQVSPNDIGTAFERVLGEPVRMEVAQRETWEAKLKARGVVDPTTRIQMLDGYNDGSITFENSDDERRKGRVPLQRVVSTIAESVLV